MIRSLIVAAIVAAPAFGQSIAERLKTVKTPAEAVRVVEEWINGDQRMIRTAGPSDVPRAIIAGDVDAFIVGDSQSGYGDDRINEGICRTWTPALWNGRLTTGEVASSIAGTLCQAGASPANGGSSKAITDATGDPGASTGVFARPWYEVLFTGDAGITLRMTAFKLSHASSDYQGSDPFLNKRIGTWAMYHSKTGTDRYGSFRIGGFVANTQEGSYTNITDGNTGFVERTSMIYITTYTSYAANAVEIRVVPRTGTYDETGDYAGFPGAGFSVRNGDNSRAGGLFTGSFYTSGWACSDWNTNVTQGTWQRNIAAAWSGAPRIVFIIMLGHNAESGTHLTNLTTLMSRLNVACIAGTGLTPDFALIPPWNVGSMSSGKRDDMFSLAGVGAYGRVWVGSLYDYYDAANPLAGGGNDVHPENDSEVDMIAGDMWTLFEVGAGRTPVIQSHYRRLQRLP